MLEKFRRSAKHPIFKVLFGVLVVSFALSGANMALTGSVSNNYVAKIGHTKIGPDELERRFAIVMRSLGPEAIKMSPEQLQAMGIDRNNVLKSMIQGELFKNQIKDLGVAVSDESLKLQIKKMPAFKGDDGQFSAQRFKEFLDNMGITEFSLKKDLKNDIQNLMLVGTVNNSTPQNLGLAETVAKAVNQERDIELINIPLGHAKVDVKPDSAPLKNYYFENSIKYQQPETRNVSYVEIPKPEKLDSAFQDKLNKIEDDIAGGSNIKEVSEKFGFVVQNLQNLNIVQVVKSEKFIQTAFSTAKGATSGVVEDEKGAYFFIQVDSVTEKSIPPLEKIKDKVMADFKAKKEKDATIKLASSIADEAQKAPSLAALATAKGLPYEKITKFGDKTKPKYEGDFAFAVLTTPKGQTTGVVPVADKGFVIVRVNSIFFPPITEQDIENSKAQLAKVMQDEIFAQYTHYLETKYPVEIPKVAPPKNAN